MKPYYSGPPGHKVPSEKIPMAIRWENLRIKFFQQLGNSEMVHEAVKMRSYYQQRWIDEASLPNQPSSEFPSGIETVFR